MQDADCLQCQGQGGRWTPTWSPHLPNPEVKPSWSKCEYCGGKGWLSEQAELHPARGFQTTELHAGGFETCEAEDVSSLWSLDLPADYLNFITEVGIVTGTDGYDMLAPDEVRAAIQRQHDFYVHGTFGDSEEDQQALEAEAAFRRRLIPFQYAGTRGDFFCYLSREGQAPIILDVYHDDFELAGGGFDEEPTPYTTDFDEHLRWVMEMLASDDGVYPRGE